LLCCNPDKLSTHKYATYIHATDGLCTRLSQPESNVSQGSDSEFAPDPHIPTHVAFVNLGQRVCRDWSPPARCLRRATIASAHRFCRDCTCAGPARDRGFVRGAVGVPPSFVSLTSCRRREPVLYLSPTPPTCSSSPRCRDFAKKRVSIREISTV